MFRAVLKHAQPSRQVRNIDSGYSSTLIFFCDWVGVGKDVYCWDAGKRYTIGVMLRKNCPDGVFTCNQFLPCPFVPQFKCTTRHAGDGHLYPPAPASPRHPVERTLYESAHTEAATAASDSAEKEHTEGGNAIASLAPIAACDDQPTSGASKATPGSISDEDVPDIGMARKVSEAPSREVHTVAPVPRPFPNIIQTALPSRPTADVEAPCSSAAAGADAVACDHPSSPSSCHDLSPRSSGDGARIDSSPETDGEGEKPAREQGSPHEVDIYGRRLDRSFHVHEEGRKEPAAHDEERYSIAAAADVGKHDQHSSVEEGSSVAAGRAVVRAEWRAEAAEAAAREAATAAATAASEARAAKRETERLRKEGLELSRWREAVVNLRDALETVQREVKGGGDAGRGEPRTTDNCERALDGKSWRKNIFSFFSALSYTERRKGLVCVPRASRP